MLKNFLHTENLLKKFMTSKIHILIKRCKLFHTDSVFCGLSALALKTNAPSILKSEALSAARKTSSLKPKPGYSKCFGSDSQVPFEKAVLANSSASREWDSNGTVFGYNPSIPGHTAGEFGHNDFYSVVIAAAH
jgi:2-methylcitrate dehydratase